MIVFVRRNITGIHLFLPSLTSLANKNMYEKNTVDAGLCRRRSFGGYGGR